MTVTANNGDTIYSPTLDAGAGNQFTLASATVLVVDALSNVLYAADSTVVSAVSAQQQSAAWVVHGLTVGGLYTVVFTLTPVGGSAYTTAPITLLASVTPAYTDWPTPSDVQARLASAGITLRGTAFADRIPNIILGVADEISRRTLRQFIADTMNTTRTYNGNDTAELEVDEMVTLTSVAVVGMQSNPGYPLSNPALVFEQNKPLTRIMLGIGSVPAWTTEGVWMPFRSIFPAGRQNVTVTGRFGFGASIPADLWNAACGEMGHRITREAIFSADGRVSSWKGGDESVSLSLDKVDGLGWHDSFEAKMSLYKRPGGRRLRSLVNRMI